MGIRAVVGPVCSLTECYSGKQFDVNDAILNALKNLQVTLDIDSSVKIDDCESVSSQECHTALN